MIKSSTIETISIATMIICGLLAVIGVFLLFEGASSSAPILLTVVGLCGVGGGFGSLIIATVVKHLENISYYTYKLSNELVKGADNKGSFNWDNVPDMDGTKSIGNGLTGGIPKE